MYLRTLIFLILLHLSFSDHPKLVIELFRHGARGPIYHNGDPHWIGREGQLTKSGQAQHLVLGASLIQRYPHLKEVLEDPSRMFLQSTEMNRTIESLKYHLWGMYHSDNVTLDDLDIYDYEFYRKFKEHKAAEHFQADNRSEVMGFTPNRIHVSPLSEEHELLTIEQFTCPNMEKLMEKEAAEEFEFIIDMIGHSIRYHTNSSLSAEHMYVLYDVIYANLFEGKPADERFHISSHVWKYLKHGAEYFIAHQRWGSELLRKLYGMPLFQKILNFVEQSHENKLPYDLVLLSAHDVTVFNLLSALEIIHPKCLISKMKGELVSNHCSFPNFASQVLIELWERDGQPKIKILYERQTVNLCGTTDGECDLAQIKDMFTKNFASLTLEEIHNYCGKKACDSEDVDEDHLCRSSQKDW